MNAKLAALLAELDERRSYIEAGSRLVISGAEYDLLREALRSRETGISEKLPIAPDRIEAYDFFNIALVFHSSRERNEVYEFLKRQYARSDSDLLREREGMVLVPRDRLTEALNELGVPQPEYPSPVVNAVYIIKAALAAAEGK